MDNEVSDDVRTELSAVLAKLETALPGDVAATLRAPAEPHEMSALADSLGGSGRLPGDLRELLSWHDGQDWNSPLSRENNRRLLSAREILQEAAFFADPMTELTEPWQSSWLPVLTNDSGDFLVYETSGEHAGALLHYWHDDPSRSLAHPSLLDWAETLLREYVRFDA